MHIGFGWKTTLGADNISAPFDAWAERMLIPQLSANSVVVMENAPFHKGHAEVLLKEKGHSVLWLPPCNPDLNPIEKKWAWMKRHRRKHIIMSVDELFRSII
ncbi:transposase [Neisseria dumasiana]|uniref:transposase n=1 Tax=Neisseria dumasiana TaxID=1931275 RepID=UPI0034441F86